MLKPSSTASSHNKARRRAWRRATLDICGVNSRRPGGRLFYALCDLADRLLQRRGDPEANQLGTVLFYAAFHSARAGEDDDFRLLLRSSLDMLVELEPIERWLPASPKFDVPAGRPEPVPYPTFLGAHPPRGRSAG